MGLVIVAAAADGAGAHRLAFYALLLAVPAAAVAAALAVTVGSFFAVQPLIDAAKHAASSLPF